MGEKRAEQFIASFHNLPGQTVAEARRGFFQLLNDHSDLVTQNRNVADAIVSNLVPKTHLEHIFHVDVLIFFRSFADLYKKFLEGDEITISKVAKQRWFFEEVLKSNRSPQDIVTQLFPSLSYASKLKLLKKFNGFLSEEEADQLYDSVLDKYGAWMASNIVTSCSVAKIRDMLKNVSLKLSHRQLKALFDKDSSLIYDYFNDHSASMEDISLINYIAKKNMDVFLDLKEKFHIQYYRIGKRTTAKLVETKRDFLIEKPEVLLGGYSRTVNLWKLVRKLGKDFRKVYAKLFAPSLNEISKIRFCVSVLKYFAKNGRASLFTTTFEQVFGGSLNLQQISIVWLQWIPDAAKREALAKLKLENGGDDDFLKFCNPQYCLDLISSRLNYSKSPNERAKCIEIMTEACVYHEDYEVFLKILELQERRLKNDHYSRYSLLRLLQRGRKDFVKNLDERHWKYLSAMCYNLKEAYISEASSVFVDYIAFLANHGRPVDKELKKFYGSRAMDWSWHLSYSQVAEKVSLEAYVDLNLRKPQQSLDDYHLKLVSCIIQYNHRRQRNQIKLLSHPKLVNAILRYIKGEASLDWNEYNRRRFEFEILPKVVKAILAQNWSLEGYGDFKKIFWEHLDILGNPQTILWFLTNEPNVFEANCQTFLKKCSVNAQSWVNYTSIWKRIKSARQAEIRRKIVDFCRLHLSSDDEGVESKIFLPEALANLLSPSEYLSLVLTYKPATEKVSVEDEEAQKLLKLQKSFVKNIRYSKASPAEVLPVVLQYCTGDYLEAALAPLTKALYRLPEDQSRPYLDQLGSKGGVSVQKHALYLPCIILDQTSAIEAIKASKLQPQSLTSALKYFAKNPSNAAWEVTKSKLPRLNKNDKFANKLVIDTVAAPPYRARYFENAWRALNDTQNVQWKKVLLKKIKDSTYSGLSEAFVTYMFSTDLMKVPRTEEFVSNYLIHSTAQTKYRPVFETLKKYKEQEWNDPQERKHLFDLVMVFFNIYMMAEVTDLDLVTKFQTGFQEIFRPAEAFEEFIILGMMKLKGKRKEELAMSILDINHVLVSKYGQLALEIYASCLKNSLFTFCGTTLNKFELYLSLLKNKTSRDDLLLLIKVLPGGWPATIQESKIFSDVISEIGENQDDQVRLHLNEYFKSSHIKSCQTSLRNPRSGGLLLGAKRQYKKIKMLSCKQ